MPEQLMTGRERFQAVMEYQPVDRVPNHEVGVWEQTKDRWEQEGMNIHDLSWDWFTGCEAFELDVREYIPVNYGMLPPFEVETLEETDRHQLGREKFVERVWDWVREYGDMIDNQHRRLGASCDWSRLTFTLDDGPSKAVRTNAFPAEPA